MLQFTKQVFRQFIIVLLALGALSGGILCCVTIFPIFLLYRSALVLLAKFVRPTLDKLVPGMAITIACDELYTKPTWTLAGFMICDGKMDFEKLRDDRIQKLIQKRQRHSKSLIYAEFQQFLTQFGSYFFWEWDTKFDLKNHVRYYDYDGPLKLPTSFPMEQNTENYCTEKDLERVYGGLISMPWKRERSMWEFLYVGKFKSAHAQENVEQCVLAYRIHHSVADGYSIINFLHELSGKPMKGPNQRPVITGRGERGQYDPKFNYLKCATWDGLSKTVLFPLKSVHDMISNFVDLFDGPNSWHLYTRKLSREYNSCITKPFEVDLVKRIKNKHGVSYNAVLCAVASGAFRKLMKDAGQKVPGEISSFYIFPLPDHPEGLTVHASSIPVTLPLANASGSLDRLKRINDAIRKPTDYMGHYFLPILGAIAGVVPVIFSRVASHLLFSTVVVSCLPGPEEPLEFCGAKMTDALNAVGGLYGQHGLSMILMSICGKQRFVAHIDKTVFPSQALFRRLGIYIEEELEELLAANNISSQFKKIC